VSVAARVTAKVTAKSRQVSQRDERERERRRGGASISNRGLNLCLDIDSTLQGDSASSVFGNIQIAQQNSLFFGAFI